MSKIAWRILFVTITLLAILGEVIAGTDGNPKTEPWTTLIVQYVPEWLAGVVFAGLVIWLPIHFIKRYRKRHWRNDNSDDA